MTSGSKVVARVYHEREKVLLVPDAELVQAEVFQAFSVLDAMEKVIKARKVHLRKRLVQEAKDTGQESDSGHTVECLGGSFTCSERIALKMDAGKVQALLEAQGIRLEAAGAFVYEPDEDKLAKLIEDGWLKAEAVAECFTEMRSTVLRIVRPPDVQEKVHGVLRGTTGDDTGTEAGASKGE